MDGLEALLDLLGLVLQLHRLLLQKVAAAVDADVLELGGVAAKTHGLLRFLGLPRLLGRVLIGQQLAGNREGMGEAA